MGIELLAELLDHRSRLNHNDLAGDKARLFSRGDHFAKDGQGRR